MIVVALEGCHGAGKTQLCREFAAAGYWVLDEGFLDMPEYALHPQSLLMETAWVCAWFQRLLKHDNELKKGRLPGVRGRTPILIADRSPFSAVFYAKSGHLLESVIRQQMEEVRTAAGIEIWTVCITVERELLWSRICDRLRAEPSREKYNEDKRSWMEAVVDFYETFSWDLVVDNSDVTIPQLMTAVIASVAGKSPRFRAIAAPAPREAASSSDDEGSPSGSSSGSEEDDDGREDLSSVVRKLTFEEVEKKIAADGAALAAAAAAGGAPMSAGSAAAAAVSVAMA
eukprot:PLAT10711.1.p1 GENE.PLAT10711.1~~PLAT10711.1.p1  ORF type:complete len:286 (-),score=125.06 PLAT10711.1:90-947(-)